MLQNYLKIATRSLLHLRGYTLINVVGLSVGLAVALLILLWAQDEIAKDKFHVDGDRIYRLLANLPDGEAGTMTWQTTPYPMVSYLPDRYPEIEDITGYDPTNKKSFQIEDREFLVDGIYALPSFFRMMTYPLIEGAPHQVLNERKAVVISANLASRIYGPHWQGRVIGETLKIDAASDYVIQGVFEDVPPNSSLQFDFVLNLEEEHLPNDQGYPWGNFDTRVLVKLQEEIDPDEFAEKIASAIADNNEYSEGTRVIMQPWERTYLRGQFENGREAGGRIEYVRLFALAALFLILIACINFMNLTTARAARRSREVGVRKTIGAGKGALITQFLIETSLITGVSLGIAVVLAKLSQPFFGELSGKDLILDFSSSRLWLLLLGTGLFTALLAGSYPAFFMSSFRITDIMRGKLSSNLGNVGLRKGLVVFQFVLSFILIVSAWIVQNQVTFIRTKHLGLDKDNVFYFRTPPKARESLETFKTQLLQVPGINELTFSSSNPLDVGSQTGDPKWQGMAPDDGMLFRVMLTDDNFLTAMNIPLAEGRDFSALLSTDAAKFLVNESAVRAMKMDAPLGKTLEFWGIKGSIIGVVEDFHIQSLHEAIGPLIIGNAPEETGLTLLRIDHHRTDQIIAATEHIFDQFSEGYPFRYDFLDDRYMQMYRSEERTGALSRWFALVAIFTSFLGLFGLIAYDAEQRKKEISIRKVLGASTAGIIRLLSSDSLRLIMLAIVIATPITYFLTQRWLEDFAYRIQPQWWLFALSAGVIVLVALLTVGYQSLRAASQNPIDNLRNDG